MRKVVEKVVFCDGYVRSICGGRRCVYIRVWVWIVLVGIKEEGSRLMCVDGWVYIGFMKVRYVRLLLIIEKSYDKVVKHSQPQLRIRNKMTPGLTSIPRSLFDPSITCDTYAHFP